MRKTTILFLLVFFSLVLIPDLAGQQVSPKSPDSVSPPVQTSRPAYVYGGTEDDDSVGASLTASPEYTARVCPYAVSITFKGSITASKPVEVRYQYESNVIQDPSVRKLVFSKPGTKEVGFTMSFGASGHQLLWNRIKILEPVQMESTRAYFMLNCIPADAVAETAEDGDQGRGTVAGRTLFVVMGVPGALSGKVDPNYRPPEPMPVPHETLYWLRVDKNKGQRLFVIESDKKGRYSIDLPPGEYFMESASKHQWDMERLPKNRKSQVATIVSLYFPYANDYMQGKRTYQKPMAIERGTSYEKDIPSQVMYVD